MKRLVESDIEEGGKGGGVVEETVGGEEGRGNV